MILLPLSQDEIGAIDQLRKCHLSGRISRSYIIDVDPSALNILASLAL